MANAVLIKIVILAKQIVLAFIVVGAQWMSWVVDVIGWLVSWLA